MKFSAGRGATIGLSWAESLFNAPRGGSAADGRILDKGHRGQVLDKYFYGVGDSFLCDGGANRRYDSFWYNPGRYLELLIDTPSEDLVLHELSFFETGYPFAFEGTTASDSRELNAILSLCRRTLDACARDIYMDCPYYEQLQYIGDARVELLCTYAATGDTRLPRRALRTLIESQRENPGGIIHSRWPSWDVQVIPNFSLIYCLMLHDYALWRGDRAFIAELLPGLRDQFNTLLQRRTAEGLLIPFGWNFTDWIHQDGWVRGVPPGASDAPNATLNWLYVLALEKLAALEGYAGDLAASERSRCQARHTARAATRAFYRPDRGLFSEDLAGRHFSEHAQILALLCDHLPPCAADLPGRLLDRPSGLIEPGIWFMHFFLEASVRHGRLCEFFRRLGYFTRFLGLGLKTLPEEFEHPRSDCHGWSAHPLHYYFTGVLGIRPGGFGFSKVIIDPHLGELNTASGTLPHRSGPISVQLTRLGDAMQVRYAAPEGVRVELRRRDGVA
jgi:hypothetical protein